MAAADLEEAAAAAVEVIVEQRCTAHVHDVRRGQVAAGAGRVDAGTRVGGRVHEHVREGRRARPPHHPPWWIDRSLVGSWRHRLTNDECIAIGGHSCQLLKQ